jgi:hypothetical protein
MIRKILGFILSISVSGICSAQEESDILDNDIIYGIVANENTCIVNFTIDKIYLDARKILPTDQGLYLNLKDDDYVLLPTLYSDSEGCFIPRQCIEVFNKCPGCGRRYFLSCDNPECPLVKNNQERKREKERKKQEEKERKKDKKKDKK